MAAVQIALLWLAAVRVSADAAACPSAGAVEANVASLIGERAEVQTAEVVDLGDHYRVVVGDSVRELSDGERRCQERARAAAVFIVLALDQAAIARAEPPAAAAAAPAESVAEAAAPSSAREVIVPSNEAPAIPGAPAAIEVQVAGLAALPFGASPGTAAGFAGTARVVWSPGRFGFAVGVGVAPAIGLEVASPQIRLVRAPIDVALRVHQVLGSIDLAAEAGPLASLLAVEGDTPEARAGGVRLELGLRAAVSARLEVGRVAPFLLAEAAVIPEPYEIASHRNGVIGHTPSVWLGLGAGVSLRVD